MILPTYIRVTWVVQYFRSVHLQLCCMSSRTCTGTGTGSSASSGGGSNSNPSHHQQFNSNNGNNSGGSKTMQPFYPQSRMRHSSSISSSSEFTSVSQQVPMASGNVQLLGPTTLSHQNQSSSRSGSDKEPDRVSPYTSNDTLKRSSPLVGRDRGGHLGVTALLGQSRESFQQALDNPCQYFV